MIQVLLGSFTCLATYWLGVRLFGDRKVGLLASLGACFHPLLIYMTGELYSEVLLIFLLTVTLLFATRIIKQGDWKGSLLTGIGLGLSTLTKPSVVLIIPFLALWLLLQQVPFAKRLETIITLLATFVLIMTPWVVRNYIVFDTFIPLATEGGVSLWAGNNPLANGGGIIPNEENWQGEDFPDLEWYGWSSLGEVNSNRKFLTTALIWIRENPFRFVSLIPRKLIRLWSPTSLAINSERTIDSRLAKMISIPYGLFLFFALIGVVSVWRDFQKLFLLCSPMLYTMLGSIMVVGGTRYAMPMVPSLILLGSVGVNTAYRYFYSRLT
jgi:4-amino-4-deoxy-L-arabinose transferase-like glycosyltransferase